MALPNVAQGDPHVAAHNNERAAINALETGAQMKSTLTADVSTVVEGEDFNVTGAWDFAEAPTVDGVAIGTGGGTPGPPGEDGEDGAPGADGNVADVGLVNAVDHGVLGNDQTADTAGMIAAAAEALATNKTLWVPPGLSALKLGATVDARYIDVQIDSPILIMHSSGPGIIFGHNAAQGVRRRIAWSNISNNAASPTNPSVRLVGLKQAQIHPGACDRLELYADSSVAADASFAYCAFWSGGGYIQRLDFNGVGTGWINDNKFFGGRFKDINFTGSYAHNGNKFYGSTTENSTITFSTGYDNLFQDVRAEGTCNVSFAVGTWGNRLISSFTSTAATRGASFEVTSDLGRENVVTTSRNEVLRAVEVMRIDRFTRLFNQANENRRIHDCVSPGIRLLKTTSTFKEAFVTGIVPLEQNLEATTAASVGNEHFVRLTRLQVSASHKLFRIYVYGYDANMVQMDPAATPFLDTNGGWGTTAGASGYMEIGSSAAAARILIINNDCKYIKIEISTSNVTGPFEYLSLTAFVKQPHVDAVARMFQRAAQVPLYQDAVPTQGLASVGESIGHASGRFTCVSRVDTALTAAAVSTNTTITVGSVTGMFAGDLIGVLLDDLTTHWTTISSIAGSVITLGVAMPGAAAIGQQVSTNRWNDINELVRTKTVTDSYTLTYADRTSVVEMNKATAVNLTVPQNSSVPLPIGTIIEVHQLGAGQITLVPDTSVTIRTASSLTSRAQYSTISLRKRGTNEWVASGDLT